ncbi:hypothetical protein CMV_015869 [Castanea mollissima]|uniref:LysM domain receptor-like kinase 4 n=1 Tax=Castanea mollissima TaxID=60419 RepID=A0A8J4R8G9_9ROSI|nr:hypothetical protein CMV_015869 [Castanea mollissima]
MSFLPVIHVFAIFLFSFCSLILAQQPYVGKATTNCSNTDTSTSVLGYSCNRQKAQNHSCQAYLTFRSQPPYNSVSAISALLASDPSQLSQINSVFENATFETNKLVLVPVNCSCSALKNQNNIRTKNLYSGTRITVPLRCACPTKNQTAMSVNYLLSYLVFPGDYVSSISNRFNVNTESTLEANGLSEQNSVIYPFTTLLVPLQDRPSNSQTIAPPPPPPSPTASPAPTSSNKSSDGFKEIENPILKEAEEESEDFLKIISSIAQSLKVYKFRELLDATDGFSPSCWIEGSVYRGTINGYLAAIKRLNGDVSKEIDLLNKINHSNIIRLSGVCFNDGHWYLVYEYAVNGPLSDWIYNNSSDGRILSWTQRIQIIFDVARGLNYLHSFTTPSHVHKDIKCSNILLDSDFRAKIAKFGLARTAEWQEGQFSLTSHIVGTRGYLAPEYLENGIVSTKLDVYAFGVLVLEIMTGKDVAALYEEENMQLSDVLNAVLHEEGQERLRHSMDPSLLGNYPSELAVFMFKLIDSCLKKDPVGRPAMDEIVQYVSRTLNTSLTWESSKSISG